MPKTVLFVLVIFVTCFTLGWALRLHLLATITYLMYPAALVVGMFSRQWSSIVAVLIAYTGALTLFWFTVCHECSFDIGRWESFLSLLAFGVPTGMLAGAGTLLRRFIWKASLD